MSQAGLLAGADDVLDAGAAAVRGVDVGALAAPALRRGGQVGDPPAVAPAAGGLEEGTAARRGAGASGGRRRAWSWASS